MRECPLPLVFVVKLIDQNPLLAAANANRNPPTGSTNGDEDTLSDYVPDSRDLSVSRAVSLSPIEHPLCLCIAGREAAR